jgi:hypothetical protein
MNSFPLYNRIVNNVPNCDLTQTERDFFSENIKNMDDLGKELIFVLIFQFSAENKKKGKNKIPYKGKREANNNDISNFTWNLQDLPITLRQMLLKFMKMHLITMEEERSRNQIGNDILHK